MLLHSTYAYTCICMCLAKRLSWIDDEAFSGITKWHEFWILLTITENAANSVIKIHFNTVLEIDASDVRCGWWRRHDVTLAKRTELEVGFKPDTTSAPKSCLPFVRRLALKERLYASSLRHNHVLLNVDQSFWSLLLAPGIDAFVILRSLNLPTAKTWQV